MGKSKFAEGLWRTTNEAVLHLDLENSTEDTGGYVLAVADLAALRETVATLRNGGAAQYKAIVVDTFDTINAWCEEETCRELGQKAMGESEGYGSDWARARGKAMDIVQQLRGLGKLLLILVHTKVEKGQFSGVNIAVPQGLGIALRGHAQVIGYIYALERGGEVVRAITFAPSDQTIAGSRYSELNNKHILLPLRDKEADGKGWVDWGGIFALFGEQPQEAAAPASQSQAKGG